MIGTLERVPLRTVWPHEAHGFTVWLEQNLGVITEATGIRLTNVQREHAGATTRVDLLATDEQGRVVVVENQLERSDHDHLGKIVSYLAAFEARAAIWISPDPRPEHVKAIAWLNEFTPADFYLLKVEAVRIGDSLPAPLLTVIVGPSEEAREVGTAKKEIVELERHTLRRAFWESLLPLVRERTPLFARISPGKDHWIAAGSGISSASFNFVVREHDHRIEFYIDRGESTWNEAAFRALEALRGPIETAFGEPLNWERLDGKRACRISTTVKPGGSKDEPSRWPEFQAEMAEEMARFERAIRPHISALRNVLTP